MYSYLILTFTPFACGKFEFTLLEATEDNRDGYIVSPGYPSIYPNNANYTWMIKTGYLAYVYFFITFMDIKISQTNQCNDFLQITETDPCCYTPLKRCGQFNKIPILTRGKKIRVSFVSDRSETGEGFFLFWNVSSIKTRPLVTTRSKTQITTFLQGTTIDAGATPMTTTSVTSETTTWTVSTTFILPLPKTPTIQTNDRNFQGCWISCVLFLQKCMQIQF
ncbi:cubilin-like [Saccostrea cucullata]|uniref:cubilin-like n=1 Tax=Saccostrea cuccullata TaxID=36930 RepID=UPI002ED4BDE7